MTEHELLKAILTTNVLKLNTLYEIREILCLKYNLNPDSYATSTDNTAEYCSIRQEDILRHFEND